MLDGVPTRSAAKMARGGEMRGWRFSAVQCAFNHGWTAARQGHTIVEFAAAVQCSFQRRTGCLLSRKYPCRVRGGGLFFLLQRSLRLREVGKGRKSADVGRRQSVEPLSRDGFSVAGGRLPRRAVFYFVLPPHIRRGAVFHGVPTGSAWFCPSSVFPPPPRCGRVRAENRQM